MLSDPLFKPSGSAAIVASCSSEFHSLCDHVKKCFLLSLASFGFRVSWIGDPKPFPKHSVPHIFSLPLFSIYWDYALIVPFSQIVCIHCHQQRKPFVLWLPHIPQPRAFWVRRTTFPIIAPRWGQWENGAQPVGGSTRAGLHGCMR